VRRLETAIFAAIALCLAAGAGALPSAGSSLGEANAALQSGQADLAISLLSSLSSPDADSAEAHAIRCRVLFTLEQYDPAQPECERAVSLDWQNSMNHLWLGRVLGERADNASFVTAYSLAKKARAEFEQAVQLNPKNAEALADLGEFYNAAPGVVGGGTAKAQGVAAQLDKIDPARAHELRAAIAQGNHDYVSAEREFRQSIAVSAHPAFQWIRLASFFRRNKRYPEMNSALQSGKAAADRDRPRSAVALFNGASVLIKADQNPALAIKLLQEYLASTNQTEEGPAFVAHTWLARLYKQTGDAAGAARERAAALALASTYRPAQDLKT
jgi:tetratricopeptide (TPR) repeat protein